MRELGIFLLVVGGSLLLYGVSNIVFLYLEFRDHLKRGEDNE